MGDATPRTAARPLTGGLDTKTPQIALDPSRSPDLLNVILNRHSVDKRPGFTPLIREQPRLNCIANAGYHAVAREDYTVGGSNVDYLNVSGHMISGHRQIYTALTPMTIEFVCRVDDLTTDHGGDAGGPYTISVRPILSKGPVHKTGDTTTTHSGGLIAWSAVNPWGDQATEGCPFAIYLFNNGGTWEFRLSFHTFNVNWILQTVTNGIAVELGAEYHVIATIDDATTTARLRVGRRRRGEATAYTDASGSFAGETYTTGNRCPIQVFDCPADFVAATNVGTPVVRPGLNLSYFFGSKRFEGAVEDIVVYAADKLSASLTALDREGKIDLTNHADVINAWTMTEPGDQYVQEITGRGNHLYFVPAGPIYDGISGAPRAGASWWFNGSTSYALVDLEDGLGDPFNPSWRKYVNGTGSVPAFMYQAVRENKQHGVECSFWVDSIEPQFEQVLIEIHAGLRLAIGIDGKLRGYCRDNLAGAGFPVGGSLYQGTVVSNTVLQPGQRYTVALMRLDGGLTLSLSINGFVDATAAVLASSPVGPAELGGMTIGIGSLVNTVQGVLPADVGTPNQVSTDSRSAFVGRIEQVRIICSDENLTPVYKDADPTELEYEQNQLWESPGPASTQFRTDNTINPTANRVDGIAIETMDQQQGRFIRYLEVNQPSAIIYDIDQAVAEAGSGQGGHNLIDKVRAHTWFVLAQWNLNVDDRDLDYAGCHLPELEFVYAGAVLIPNGLRDIHVQTSGVQDDLAALGPLVKRCTNAPDFGDVLRPYRFRSPKELCVSWQRGMLTPLTGTNPITMVADWQHQESGERFLNAACARQIYWAKLIWKRGSPFADEIDVDALHFGGQDGDHVVVKSSHSEQETTGAGTRTTVVFECWVYPYRLDGTRLIAFKGNPAGQLVNFAIATQNGALELTGTADGNTVSWRFREGFYQNDTILRTQSIRANAWNHIHVTLKGAGPLCRVNGNLVPLVDSSVDSVPATTDGFATGTADTGPYSLFIGGLPEGRTTITYNPTPGSFTENYQSFHGLLTEVRQRNAEDTTLWPAGQSGIPPTARYVSDANTYYLLHLNEGEGWGFDNAAVPAAGDDARSEIRELVLIADGLAESRNHRYDWVVFRDRLFITNGESRPQRIRFTRFTDATGPFHVEQVGMLQPFPVEVTVVDSNQLSVINNLTAGVYQVSMSFVNSDGSESDASLLGTITNPANEALRVTNVPRSPDPQVIGRQFYVSADGGGSPLNNLLIFDNESLEIELDPRLSGAIGLVEAGSKLPGPRARHVAVGQFSLILANLPDEPAGQNSFIVSEASEPSYFNADNSVVIDSEDGKPVVSVAGLSGRTFISKRDSVWQFALLGISILDEFGLGLQLVNKSIGVGGGDSLYDNIVFGAGDKGVHRFDGSNVAYASEELEGDWNTVVDRSDDGLLHMFGSYYWPNSQYWLSVRTKGQTYNERVYVLHTAIGDRQAWTRLVLPKHTYLTSRLRGDNQDPQLLLGGVSGQILRFNDEGAGVFIDGTDGSDNDNGTVTLTGTADSGSTTGLALAGANFDVTGPGLRGVEVELTFADGTRESRIIESNTATTLAWRTPTSQAVASTTTFIIGGYVGYWSSGWADPQDNGQELLARKVDIDYLPSPVMLQIETRTAVGAGVTQRAWDESATVETNAQDMTTGYQTDPFTLKDQNRGHYFRIRFSTRGIGTPFYLVAWALRWTPSAQR